MPVRNGEVGMNPDRDERRSRVRYKVNEACHAIVDGREYRGSVVTMSMDGAAILMNVRLEEQPPAWKPMELNIERIGQIRAKVVRPIIGGVAIEFILDRDKDRTLIDILVRVLNEYAGTAGGASGLPSN